MDTDDVWRVIDAERVSLADLIDGLSAAQLQAPSLCAGWRVSEVAAHLTLAQLGVADAAVAFARARLDFNRMIYDTARRQAKRFPAQRLAGQLRAMAGSRRKAPGVTELEPLIDVLVHGQDIAVPLGLERSMPTQAAMTAASGAGRTFTRSGRRDGCGGSGSPPPTATGRPGMPPKASWLPARSTRSCSRSPAARPPSPGCQARARRN